MAPSPAPRVGWGDRPAVVGVDLIRAFTEPGGFFSSDLSSQVDATARLCAAARQAGAPVIFTRVGYGEDLEAEIGPWAAKVPANAQLRAGSPDVEVDPRLGAREDEVVTKPFASAFFATGLAGRLRDAGVDTVVLAGTSTSGCVRATAVDGLQHGFRVIVVAEAVGDRDPAAGAQSLRDLDAKYADVVALDEALAHLAGVRA